MEAAALPPLPAAVSDALSARSVTLTAKCESTARAIASIGSGQLLSYAEVAALAGNPGAALATSSHRHKLYEEALDFVLPLHRVMSTKDHFARVDGAVGLGAVGRVFKCAIRELEGGYASLKKVPSINGLPPPKPEKKRKRSDDDGAAAEPPKPQPVPAEDCKAMLAAIKEFQSSESVATAELWRHGAEIKAKLEATA